MVGARSARALSFNDLGIGSHNSDVDAVLLRDGDHGDAVAYQAKRVKVTEATFARRRARRRARLAPNLPEKLERQREVRLLESRRDQAWRDYDHASREVDVRKEALLDEIGRRMEQRSDLAVLFTIRWRLA